MAKLDKACLCLSCQLDTKPTKIETLQLLKELNRLKLNEAVPMTVPASRTRG